MEEGKSKTENPGIFWLAAVALWFRRDTPQDALSDGVKSDRERVVSSVE